MTKVERAPAHAQLSLGLTIRSLRAYHRLTLAELADEVGLTKSALSKLENGKCGCSLDALLRISQALGFDKLSELFEFVEEIDERSLEELVAELDAL